MADADLEGFTLGQKHQHFNGLVQNSIRSNRTVHAKDFNYENGDIINLLNIDIASHQKNVEYILKVFTCEDMLYVSRAIARTNWIITDQKYADIINAKYLSTNLFPRMCSKAICKLLKHIRNNLVDEKRVEEFYSYEKRPEEAAKWLPHCSLEFIMEKITNHFGHLTTTLLKRLCEKSINVLEIYIKHDAAPHKRNALQANMFLLTSNTNQYLDLVETVSSYEYPTFNKRATSVIMKNCSSRLINKFPKYFDYIHLPTFIKCLKQENIKDFLINQIQNIKVRKFHLQRLMIFIESMPQDIRFEFVKFVFIDKKHLDSKETSLLKEKELKGMYILNEINCNYLKRPDYIWYQFAPFDIAFQKIKDLIGSTTSAEQKKSMLEVLLTSAQHNITHERIFLEYLRDKQKNIKNHVKEHILKKLLSTNNFLQYDQRTWNVLNDILTSIDIYSDSEIQQPSIIEALILYKIVNEEKVPQIVEKKFTFNSLKPYYKNLSEKETELVFSYLYGLITTKLVECNATSETEFKEKIDILEKVLNLLKDSKKDLDQYPELISIIKDLIKIKSDSSWTVSMETLFNVKKTWRKILFNESLALSPTESVLINALKHGPSLLENNKDAVQNILSNDKIALKQVLGKIKIYWANSMAINITETYMNKLNVLGDHKATTRGLSILLPRQPLQEVIKKYAPKDAKINWDKIDEVELSVQQQFAKNMHNGRPQPDPETILWFAKGDYLRYALPSLLSIFYNLSATSSPNFIPKLFDAPVSLQKHGIRLAVSKMEIECLGNFSKMWKSNKNASIRSVMFKNVYDLLCKVQEPEKIQAAWELLEIFIDNLTFEEDKAIYKLLFEVKDVPLVIRGRFYMKSYNFLRKLINIDKYEEYKQDFYTTFAIYSIDIMDQLLPQYVPEIINEFIEREFMKNKVSMYFSVINLISSYLMQSSDQDIQLQRYKEVLQPILKQCFTLITAVDDNGERFIVYNLNILLNQLRQNLQERDMDKNKVVPYKMFALIQDELERSIPVPENYILLTKWKLTVSFTTILSKYQPILNWKDACNGLASEFGSKCNDFLKEDCDKYFPRIYLLFAKSLKIILEGIVPVNAHWDIYKCFTRHENFIQGYLTAIELIPKDRSFNDDDKEMEQKFQELLKIISARSEAEIKIHYYNKFLMMESNYDSGRIQPYRA